MDEFITKELQQKYIERLKKELELNLIAVQKGDLKPSECLGHKLKGNGTSFGYQFLSNVGALLEQSAKEKDLEKIQAYLQQIKSFIDQV